jgi:glycosyltransferase involved in cell wall biosynthesis
MKPKVTVAIIALSKAENTLRDSLDSVLSQTYGNIEVTIVYDSYLNNTVVEQIKRERPNSKVNYYRTNGVNEATALNVAVKNATGKYFSWLTVNDRYLEDKIDDDISLLIDDNTAIASGWTIVNQNTKQRKVHHAPHALEMHPGPLLAFAQGVEVNTMAMLLPISYLKKYGFSEVSSPVRDYKLLGSMIAGGITFRVSKKNNQKIAYRLSDDYSHNPKAKTHDDFSRSEIIADLTPEEVSAYFFECGINVVDYYKEMLTDGYPRVCAFLMEKVIRGLLAAGDVRLAERMLVQDFSGLTEDQFATSAKVIASKITEPSHRKKILFSSAQWLTGGMERVMSVLFEELKDEYEVMLITPYDDRQSQIGIPSYITNIKIDVELFKRHFDSLILAYALLLDVDAVIGYMNLFGKQQNLYNLCVGTKIKTIASNHEYYFYPYKSKTHYDAALTRLEAFKNCDAIVWPTNFSAALCGLYAERNYVIGNPNKFPVVQKPLQKNHRKQIICVGRFNDPIKRIDRALECFSKVLQTVPDASLVLVGKYEYETPIDRTGRTIKSMIESLAIPLEKITFAGEVSNVEHYFKQARVLLITSVSEGFGMVVNEAACFGVPSVCNYMPGIEDIVVDKENGLIVEQDDINSMAIGVSRILEDDELRSRLSDAALKNARRFEAHHIGYKWRVLINTLLNTEEKEAQRVLASSLAYKSPDTDKLIKVLAGEANDILMQAIKNASLQDDPTGIKLLMSKILGAPKRLRANVEFEGYTKTLRKILTRSMKLIRKKLYAKR